MHSFFGHLLMMQQLRCMMQIAEVNLFLENMNAKHSQDAGHGIFFRFERTSTQIIHIQ